MRPISLPHLPLQALRCFEAAARHLSFKRAADELCLTPSAISHQIKSLESRLGSPLFIRQTRHVELNEAGRLLFAEVAAAFRQIETALQITARQASRKPVRLAISPMMQRILQKDFLDAFEAAQRDYGLEIVIIPNALYVPHREVLQEADVALLIGSGFWPQATAHPLVSLRLTAFCPRHLVRHPLPLDDPRQLQEYRWLHNREFPDIWPWFLGLLGYTGLQSRLGNASFGGLLDLLNPDFATDGIALLDEHLTPYALAGRDWQRMLTPALSSGAYYLVCREGAISSGASELIRFFSAQVQRLGWPSSF